MTRTPRNSTRTRDNTSLEEIKASLDGIRNDIESLKVLFLARVAPSPTPGVVTSPTPGVVTSPTSGVVTEQVVNQVIGRIQLVMSPLMRNHFPPGHGTTVLSLDATDFGYNSQNFLVFSIRGRVQATEDPYGCMPIEGDTHPFISNFELLPNNDFNSGCFELHTKSVIEKGENFIDLVFQYFKP